MSSNLLQRAIIGAPAGYNGRTGDEGNVDALFHTFLNHDSEAGWYIPDDVDLGDP